MNVPYTNLYEQSDGPGDFEKKDHYGWGSEIELEMI